MISYVQRNYFFLQKLAKWAKSSFVLIIEKFGH